MGYWPSRLPPWAAFLGCWPVPPSRQPSLQDAFLCHLFRPTDGSSSMVHSPPSHTVPHGSCTSAQTVIAKHQRVVA